MWLLSIIEHKLARRFDRRFSYRSLKSSNCACCPQKMSVLIMSNRHSLLLLLDICRDVVVFVVGAVVGALLGLPVPRVDPLGRLLRPPPVSPPPSPPSPPPPPLLLLLPLPLLHHHECCGEVTGGPAVRGRAVSFSSLYPLSCPLIGSLRLLLLPSDCFPIIKKYINI